MSTRDKLFRLYWRLQSVIAPGLRYSQSIYEDYLNDKCNPNFVWLDLGCGHQLLPPWRYHEEQQLVRNSKTIIGLDYSFDSLKKHRSISNRIRGDISHLPFANDSFDFITSNMVFEHLRDPEVQLAEVNRILKPQGTLIIHTPSISGYTTIAARLMPRHIRVKLARSLQDRREEEVFPTYYRINSVSKIREMARRTGFRVEEIKMIVSSAQFVIVPPILVFELLWIRLLMTDKLRMLRTNIIARLTKHNLSDAKIGQ